MCSAHFNTLKTVFLGGITALLQRYIESVPAKKIYINAFQHGSTRIQNQP